MSAENNLHERSSDFSPSSVPRLPPLKKKMEEQMNSVKVLTFVDYIDKCRAAIGDDAVLAAIPTHLKNDIAKEWYQALLKEKTEKTLELADDVIRSLLKTYANPEANNIWDKRYDPKVLDAYLESSEFAQQCFYIQSIQDLEEENHKLRKEIEDLKNPIALLSVHSSDVDSSQSGISTPTSSAPGAPSQPHLRPLRIDYYENKLRGRILIPYHDNMAYNELGPLLISGLRFRWPNSYNYSNCENLRFFRSDGEGLITPEIWPIIRAELKVIEAIFR